MSDRPSTKETWLWAAFTVCTAIDLAILAVMIIVAVLAH